MKALELRLGNLIQVEGRTLVVNEIMETSYSTGHETINGWEEEEITGIPLTEEWLLKLGFEKTSIGNIKFVKGPYAIHENYFQGKMTGYNLCIKGVDWHNVASVDHVHQLQNLYFALTGEELKCA